ncbi:MAG: EscU/YscU/HrcU family type III secretion system export apparatus switch protein, partial [Oscillospiraceae bacterium]
MSSSKQQATALKYAIDKENSAPVVVASGSGTIAQKIIDIAIENNVPVYQDDSLATLLAQLKVGNEIPPSLFQA